MGKGDKKTRRGKIWMGTYGVRRPRKKRKANIIVTETKEQKKAKKALEEISQPNLFSEENVETTPQEITVTEPKEKPKKATTKKATTKKSEPAEKKEKATTKKSSSKKAKAEDKKEEE